MNENFNELIDLFFEGNYSDLKSNTISRNKLRINTNCIFLTIFDGNFSPSKYLETLNTTGISLINCNGFIIDNSSREAFGRNINNRTKHTEIRSEISDIKGKKIPVKTGISNINFSSQQKDFYFLDMNHYLDALLTRQGQTSLNQLYRGLFYYISETYKNIKKQFPAVTCDTILIANQLDGPIGQILENANRILNTSFLSKFDFFDNYMFVSPSNLQMIPIAFRKKFKQTLNLKNINYSLQSLFKNIDSRKTSENPIVSKNAKDIATEPRKKENKSQTVLNKIVAELSKEKLISSVDENGIIKPQIDNKTLSKILKKYKITDPDILANIKSALDMYIELKGDKLTEEEAFITILKAINYTLHGKEELDEKYINDPKRLILKLKNISTHKTPLNFPENKNLIIDPSDIIDIKHTTGVWRQKQEFDKTIHVNIRKLFETLEYSPINPIKIKKIDYDIIDDDVNRYLLYKITLLNQTGGKKVPYTVELKVPASLNDRYFKLNCSTYIMATQQMLKPVTKTEKDQVRMLSSYSVVRIGIKNLKFNPADIDDILNYIKVRYPKIINTLDVEKCIFSDGSIIHLIGNDVYSNSDKKISIDNTGKLIDEQGINIKKGKYEFLYEIILKQIQDVNKEDKLTRTKKTIPYIYIYIGGFQLPLILYMWQLKGLLTTLNDFGIDYNIEDERIPLYPYVKMSNGKFLIVKPKTIREELIANGLLTSRIKNEINNLDDPEEIHPWIDQNYGSTAILKMRILTQNQIDPVTRELLEFENLPTNLPSLISEHCVEKLLNDKMDSLADLKIYRARLSEMILNIMYKQITAAHNHYSKKVEFGDENAQIVFIPDWIMNDIMSDGSLQHAEPVSPVDEIYFASRTIKSGKGGVPKKTMFKPEHRNIHPSHYGIMSANTTPEGGNVGLLVSHTLTPVIVNEYGSYGLKDITSISGWDTLSINEALVPFQNEMDSDRLVMAATHAKQVTPTDGCEPPLVCTGAEFIVPQISSSRFTQKAKQDGEVIEVIPNKTMTVRYKDNSEEVFDIIPRMSRTKMGVYISLEMQTPETGYKIKKDQIIAHTKNFSQDGIYSSGTNAFMAVMQYMGMGHEDSYVINKNLANKMTRDIVKELYVIIPPETKVIYIEKEIGKTVTKQDILVEFSYHSDINDYLDMNQIEEFDDDEEILNTYVQGFQTIKKMALDGEIVDIKLFINNKNSVDKQIVQYHNKLVKETREIINKLSLNAITKEDKLKTIDNINLKFTKFGGHKLKGGAEFLGAKIVYYIKQKQPLQIGDKLATRFNISRFIQ